MTALTDADRAIITSARGLMVFDVAETRASSGTTDTIIVLAETLGEAKYMLAELVAIVRRLDGGAEDQGEDSRRLGAIREVLADREVVADNRQYALERIERIAEGGQA